MTKAEQKFQIQNHEKEASSHLELGKCMSKSADAHSALASHFELLDPDVAKSHTDLAACHKAMAVSHAEAGARHLECAKNAGEMPTQELGASSEKAASSDDVTRLLSGIEALLSKTVPTAARTIPTQDAPRLVPRYGAPTQSDARSKVDPRLAHLIGEESVAS